MIYQSISNNSISYYCTMVSQIILYHIISLFTANLYFTVSLYILLHSTTLHFIILYKTISYYIILYHTIWYYNILYHVILHTIQTIHTCSTIDRLSIYTPYYIIQTISHYKKCRYAILSYIIVVCCSIL